MANLHSGNRMASDPGCFALAQVTKSQHGNALGGSGNPRKVRPHLIVKKRLGQSVDDLANAPNIDWNPTFAVEIIRQGAKRHYVIQMDMSNEYIPNFMLRSEIQRRSRAAGIDQK